LGIQDPLLLHVAAGHYYAAYDSGLAVTLTLPLAE